MSKKWKTIVSIIIISILMPLAVGIGVSLPIFKQIVINNDWIGFWGSYVGTILGGMITLYVLWKTITDNENARKRDEKIKFFDKVMEISTELRVEVGNLFALATRSLAAPSDSELYGLYLQQSNNLTGIDSKMNILLASRNEIYDCEEFLYKFTKIIGHINEVSNRIDEISETKLISDKKAEEINFEIHNIFKELIELQEILIECTRKNIYGIVSTKG